MHVRCPDKSRINRNLMGLFFKLRNYLFLCIIENEYLNSLVRIVLPARILDYFLITGVEKSSTEIRISLDERATEALVMDENIDTKGFMDAVDVTDFPISDPKVILSIRRRRWSDRRTGKSFSVPIDLDVVAKDTRYSKEFGAF